MGGCRADRRRIVGAVDRQLVTARPVRRQVRLVAGQAEGVPAERARRVTGGEAVGDAEASDRGGGGDGADRGPNETSGCEPCISQMRRACRLTRIQVLVWTVRRPCRFIQPVRPFGFSGSTTRPHWWFTVVRSTHSQVGAPSGVAAGRWATIAPPGDERTVAPCGADTIRKRGPPEARACAGRATASRASPTANVALHRRARRCSASSPGTHGPPSPRLPVRPRG